ncbi:hypothetical protein B0H11DRAFT_1986757 [Mycena galericulata]|nr:hypothetical protein B0H11DRAFT_1986757 [Mycena galericulata]
MIIKPIALTAGFALSLTPARARPYASLARRSTTPLDLSVIIGASVAVLASGFLLALLFCVLWRRPRQRRQYRHNAGAHVQRPLLHRLDTKPVLYAPAEMKPAYLDSPRPRRASVILSLSPLAASQQPGFIPRPVPSNVPVSVCGSNSHVASMQFPGHARRASATNTSDGGVSPDDLADMLDELSRHYVLTDPGSPPGDGLRHSRSQSTSLTGRSRVFKAYS